jgi:hypothetical protein
MARKCTGIRTLGSYDQLKFNEQNLMDKNHKDYETAIELLKSISTNKRVILTSNLYNNLTDSADKK